MDYSKFTPQFKDEVLLAILSQVTPYKSDSFEWHPICSDCALLDTILNQFKERGFVQSFNLRHSVTSCNIIVTARAIDFLAAGGFTFEVQFFEIEMQKAILECEKLQSEPGLKNHIEQISRITGILTNTISAFSTLFGSTK